MQCPQCQHENPSGAKFCVQCASPLIRRCPACGTEAPPTAKFCPGCAAPLTAPAAVQSSARTAPTDAGERRHLTALFCDLVGSTEIASRLDPEEWHRISKAYQEAAAAAVTRFGGHVDKFLGDGLVCFFGVPQAHEDDAERAVRAGLAIVDTVQALNGNAADQAAELHVRVGLHTGSAVVAHGGGESKDVFGDTPNIAARVQSVAEPDTVCITAATQRLVAGLFVVEERGAQQLKGAPRPVVLYRVVQPSGVRSRLDVLAGRHTPFVGRQSELGVLADAWERVVEGMGRTVLVQGEAGIGKSRLCYQLREQLAGQPHTWLECRCSPYTSGTPFRPVTELVEQALTFQSTDAPADRLAKLRIGLERGGFAGDEPVALLAEWLELPESAGYSALSINPEVRRRKTLETLAAWNLKLAELQPMVLLVEDLHWCDPSSLELLGRLVAQSATAQVLLIGTARPEFVSPWPARSNLQTLPLSRLTKRQTREMVDALWLGIQDQGPGTAGTPDVRPLAPETIEALVTRADGIPLFAEELTHAVSEAGGNVSAAGIPVTLQDSLLARLDRLAGAKEVAQRAAVLGREFSHTLVVATADMDEATLQRGLERLVEAELLFERGVPPQATYTFKHALVQEAAYESLLKSARSQLHRRVAVVLAEQFPEVAASQPELMAQHFDAAGLPTQAGEYWRRAGMKAIQRSPNEASQHLERALETLTALADGPERDQLEFELLTALGPALMAARGFTAPEVGRTYERAHELCRRVRDTPQLFTALWGLWLFNFNSGRLQTGREIAEQAMGLAQRQSDPGLLMQAHHMLAATFLSLGPLSSSRSHFDGVLALYDPSKHRGHASLYGGHDPGVCSHGFGAHVLWMLGYPDLAQRRSREAIALARTLDQPASLAHAFISAALLQQLRRDPESALELATAGLAISAEHHLVLYRTFMRFARGWALAKTGHQDEGLVEMQEARAAMKAFGIVAFWGLSFSGIVGEVCREAGQVETGLTAVHDGLAMADVSGETSYLAELTRVHGELVLDRGDLKEAAIFLRSALDIAHAQEARSFELRAASSLARLWRDQGKRAEARDLLAPIYGWFTEGFDTRDLIEAKALLDEL
jgi:class 3 adenylate cyclase/tetratricopeptide (TPR) repeat protein